jgi:hypothetical protein
MTPERYSKVINPRAQGQHLVSLSQTQARGAMAFDEFERVFKKCIRCGTHTIWLVQGVPVCKACALELETDPDPLSPGQSGESVTTE